MKKSSKVWLIGTAKTGPNAIWGSCQAMCEANGLSYHYIKRLKIGEEPRVTRTVDNPLGFVIQRVEIASLGLTGTGLGYITPGQIAAHMVNDLDKLDAGIFTRRANVRIAAAFLAAQRAICERSGVPRGLLLNLGKSGIQFHYFAKSLIDEQS